MDELRALVKDDIEKIENLISNLIYSSNDIYKDIEIFLSGSSKRIRSILCITYLKANNAEINTQIIDLIAAGELIHNASLLHDDVIDDAEKRRGDKSFYKKYNSKISILSGDYLLSIAVKQLLKINNTDILNIFLSATEKMSSAELNQYFKRNKDINFDEYIEIIKGKTASLFTAILESAAILASIDINNAIKFGELYGELFQINNDTQNDSIINDKKNGIKTVIDILGLEKTQSLKDNYKEELRDIVKRLPNKRYSEGLENLIKIL